MKVEGWYVEGWTLVKSIVFFMRKYLLLARADIDIEDYMQIGMIGYIKAKRAFDANKGEFTPYARRRITGEIIDWNRRMGSRYEEKRLNVVYIEDLAGYNWLDMKRPSAEELLSRKENIEWIQKLISEMRDSYRNVLTHYYFEEKPLHEIGKMYGVTESRMSQILNGALRCLQGRIGEVKMPPRGSRGWKRDPITKKWVAPALSLVPMDPSPAPITEDSGDPKDIVIPQRKKREKKEKDIVVTTARQEVELVVKLKFIVEVIHQ